MDKVAVRTKFDESVLERLLGLDNSKIGFYAEVKQKIHELEAANLGLRSKSSEFQALFDSISDGVIVYDSRGKVQHRNHVPGACRRVLRAVRVVPRPGRT